MPEELWTEVCDIVQEAVIKTIPKKKNAKRQNGCLRRPYKELWGKKEAKSKGERERYSHLNAEFQRIAQRDKKAFLSDQCKEIEKNNRMGKTNSYFLCILPWVLFCIKNYIVAYYKLYTLHYTFFMQLHINLFLYLLGPVSKVGHFLLWIYKIIAHYFL